MFGPLTPEITRLMSTHSKSTARSVYVNALEFGPRDFATGGISTLLNFPPIGRAD